MSTILFILPVVVLGFALLFLMGAMITLVFTTNQEDKDHLEDVVLGFFGVLLLAVFFVTGFFAGLLT